MTPTAVDMQLDLSVRLAEAEERELAGLHCKVPHMVLLDNRELLSVLRRAVAAETLLAEVKDRLREL